MTKVTEQKPTAEADSLVQSWQNRNNYPDARYLGQLKEAIATSLAARDAEIETKDELLYTLKMALREQEGAHAENQKQRALLVEACRLVKAEKQGVLSIDRPYFDQEVKKFLSNPVVVELMKGAS